jgi:hypothetical protein
MTQMKTQTLEYYLHDEWDAFRFELAGSLSGDGAQSVYQAWRTALSITGDRPVIFDISFVVEADERGRALPLLWQQNGARFIAASPESRALAEPILGEALPASPAKQGWLRRLIALILGRLTGSAVISTGADIRHSFSASARHKNDGFNAVSGSGRSECRVP